jgi:hypothetical protein
MWEKNQVMFNKSKKISNCNFLYHFNQWLSFPDVFRITLQKQINISKPLVNISKPTDTKQYPINKHDDEIIDMAKDLGTLIWRIRRRLQSPEITPKITNKISFDIDSVLTTLTNNGIDIKDHTGDNYYDGMALHVIAAQPLEGLTDKKIVETLSPTIYYQKKVIQRGEVIIGIPANCNINKD